MSEKYFTKIDEDGVEWTMAAVGPKIVSFIRMAREYEGGAYALEFAEAKRGDDGLGDRQWLMNVGDWVKYEKARRRRLGIRPSRDP